MIEHVGFDKLFKRFWNTIAFAHSEGSGEHAHLHSLARAFATRTLKAGTYMKARAKI